MLTTPQVLKALKMLSDPDREWYYLANEYITDHLRDMRHRGDDGYEYAIRKLQELLSHPVEMVRRAAEEELNRPPAKTQDEFGPERTFWKIPVVGVVDSANKAFLYNLAPSRYADDFEGMPGYTPHVDLWFEESMWLYLLSSPGQRRFDFMWEILAPDSIAYVLVIDATKAETFRASRRILEAFRSYQEAPYAVALSNSSAPDAFEAGDIQVIFRFPENVPVLGFDPSQPDSAAQILVRLFSAMLPSTGLA